MRALAAAAIVAMLLPLAAGHDNGRCLPRTVIVWAGDGTMTGSMYEVDYSRAGDPVPSWYYLENGNLPGVQTGAPHLVFGNTWGHDHNCYHAVVSEQDYYFY
jgi:hypothetical protein